MRRERDQEPDEEEEEEEVEASVALPGKGAPVQAVGAVKKRRVDPLQSDDVEIEEEQPASGPQGVLLLDTCYCAVR